MVERGRTPSLEGFDKIIRKKIAQDNGFLGDVQEEEEKSDLQQGLSLLMKYVQQLDKKYTYEIEELKKSQKQILDTLKELKK